MVLTMVACRERGRGSGTRNPAVVKAARRARAKGWRWGVEGAGEAWREEEWVGSRRVCRPERVVVRGCGGGGGGSVGGAFLGSVGMVVEGGGGGEPAESRLSVWETEAALSMLWMSKLFR